MGRQMMLDMSEYRIGNGCTDGYLGRWVGSALGTIRRKCTKELLDCESNVVIGWYIDCFVGFLLRTFKESNYDAQDGLNVINMRV